MFVGTFGGCETPPKYAKCASNHGPGRNLRVFTRFRCEYQEERIGLRVTEGPPGCNGVPPRLPYNPTFLP